MPHTPLENPIHPARVRLYGSDSPQIEEQGVVFEFLEKDGTGHAFLISHKAADRIAETIRKKHTNKQL